MFEKGHKNKRIHLLRLAVMAASLSFCLFGCSGLHAVKNRGRSAEMDTDSLVVYSPHPLDFINPIVSEFESQTGIPVQVRTGGTGELLKGTSRYVMCSGAVLYIQREQEKTYLSLISVKMKNMSGRNLKTKREI